MQESFYRMICQLGIFMICAQAIIHFRPRESYGKYMKMLLSVMILVQIFQPFSNFFFGMSTRDFQEQIAYFQAEMEVRMQAAVESAGLSEQKLQEMTLKEVQERIAAQEKLEELPKKDEKVEGDDVSELGENVELNRAYEQEGTAGATEADSEPEPVSGTAPLPQEGNSKIEEVEIKVQWDTGEE